MMAKALLPKDEPLSIKVVRELITLVVIIFVILLAVSAFTIISQYSNIILGNAPNEVQKMSLDYSLTIFAGSAAFLFLYRYKFEDIVYGLLGIKKVKHLKHKEIDDSLA